MTLGFFAFASEVLVSHAYVHKVEFGVSFLRDFWKLSQFYNFPTKVWDCRLVSSLKKLLQSFGGETRRLAVVDNLALRNLDLCDRLRNV